jgi:hypothetical protein
MEEARNRRLSNRAIVLARIGTENIDRATGRSAGQGGESGIASGVENKKKKEEGKGRKRRKKGAGDAGVNWSSQFHAIDSSVN